VTGCQKFPGGKYRIAFKTLRKNWIKFSGAFAKLRRANISFVISVCPSAGMSVRPHRTTWLPLDGLSWKLLFDYFSKFCRENLSLMKIWHEWPVLYVKTNIHVWSHVAQFFLEWEMFQKIIYKKSKPYFMFDKLFFFLKSCRLWDNVEKIL
jgi:hypothetical protein